MAGVNFVGMSRISFRVVPPIDRPGSPVFLTGDHPALGGWEPSQALQLNWQPPFHTGEFEIATGGHFEYKITRGGWQCEAVDAHGQVPPNSWREVWLDATLHHTVADWKDRYSGRLTREVIYSRALAQERELLIWLPPGYARDSAHRFPLIVLHDGASVFDPSTSGLSRVDLAADEWVGLLARKGVLPESLVVGVCHPEGFSQEGGNLRDFELSPELGGDAYAEFVATELVAHMDARHRTIAKPEARSLGGFGLGALSTFHTALRHPGVFQNFICLSTSFEDVSQSLPANAVALKELEKVRNLEKGVRMYFDYGDREIDECYEQYHAILGGLLREKGWRDGQEFTIARLPGEGHTSLSWRARLGEALRFLAR